MELVICSILGWQHWLKLLLTSSVYEFLNLLLVEFVYLKQRALFTSEVREFTNTAVCSYWNMFYLVTKSHHEIIILPVFLLQLLYPADLLLHFTRACSQFQLLHVSCLKMKILYDIAITNKSTLSI